MFLAGCLPHINLAILFIIIMLIDWSIQQYLKIMSNNWRRLVTGIFGGLGVGSVIWKCVQGIVIYLVQYLYMIK
jgi:uncharacterized membrane protein